MEPDIIEIFFKKLVPEAQIPEYAEQGSSGMDVRSSVDVTIHSGSWVAVETGLSADIPMNCELQVRPRSGLALKHGVTVLNAPGTIDSSFLGHIKVILINNGHNTFDIKIGDRIAQLVPAKVLRARSLETQEITKTTQRGTGGFGSTGVL